MKFFEFRFRQADFYTLPVARRVYAVRLAQLHNDLRYIRQLVKVANNGVQKLRGVDQQVSLHQLLFAVGYGTVHYTRAGGLSLTTGKQVASLAISGMI